MRPVGAHHRNVNGRLVTVLVGFLEHLGKDPMQRGRVLLPSGCGSRTQRHERPLPALTRLAHLVIPRRLAPRSIVGVDVIFLRPPTRTNVLSSSSPVRLTARRRMHTIIKMIVIAVAIGMWIGPRSVVIAFVLGEAAWGLTC